jgi:uncharacterized membrane protein
LSIAGRDKDKSSARELVSRGQQLKWSGSTVFEKAAGTGYYLPVIYVPHALGLYISRQLDLSMASSYALTRGIVVSTSIALIAWALALHAPNVLTLMLLLTPMALFQLSSPTIDGLCMAIALLIIGLGFKVSTSLQRNNNFISFWETCLYGLILVLCTTRTNLLPVLLLPLAYLAIRYSHLRLIAVSLLYILTLGWIIFGFLTTYDDRVVRPQSTLDILQIYLSRPLEFFELLIQTISNNENRRFYRDSFFGILGWLDTPIPRQAVRILATVSGITAIAMALTTEWRSFAYMRLIFLLVGFAGIILIFFAMAVTWTTYPAQSVLGVQGRYFLIPCLFMAAAVGRVPAGMRNYGPFEVTVIIIFFLYSQYLLVATLVDRYQMANLYW